MRFIKKNKLVILICILTIISCLPVFMNNLAYGGDLNFHLKRIEAITENIRNHAIGYPIYFKYLNNYGYASGLFYPDLFLYIPALLNVIGISLFTSYKIFLVLIKLLSLISIYYTVKGINKNKNSATLAIILYAFSSYPFIDMFERGALAETITIIFIPIVLRGIYEIIYGDIKKYYFLPLGMLGLLFSHIISLYLMTVFILIFLIINFKKITKEKLKAIVKSVIIFILIGSHFLFPLIEQMSTGKFYYNIQENVLAYNNVPLIFLFIELPYYILMGDILKRWYPCGVGVIYLYLIIYYINNKKKFDEISKKFMFCGIACLLFNLKLILNIPIINKMFGIIQFPYRIYILATVLFIISFTRVFKEIKPKKIFFITLMLFSLNLFYPFVNIKTRNITDEEIMNGEYLPIEYSREINTDTINSTCKIEYDTKRKIQTNIDYKSECDNTTLELPIIYYKGYEVRINDKESNIRKSNNGLIELKTNEKQGNIQIYYKGTHTYRITKYISVISLIIIVVAIVRKHLYEKE